MPVCVSVCVRCIGMFACVHTNVNILFPLWGVTSHLNVNQLNNTLYVLDVCIECVCVCEVLSIDCHNSECHCAKSLIFNY